MSHGAALAASEPSPYEIPSRKLGIWMFIVADAATFGAMLVAYGYLRVANPDLIGIMLPNQVLKQLLQRMRFRNHGLNPLKSRALHKASTTCESK